MAAPLRRTRGDLAATAGLSLLALVAVAAAALAAPINGSTLEPVKEPLAAPEPLAAAPESLAEAWRAPAAPGSRPLSVDGVTVSQQDSELAGLDPEGNTLWSYRRDEALCAAAQGFGRVVGVYHYDGGCGEAVSLEADSGSYADTRQALAAGSVEALSSNDRVGIAAPERVELWRSDLVRTVEYGEIPAAQEPATQPHPGCTITSALTRQELLAVTERCPEEPDERPEDDAAVPTEPGTWLRIMSTSPEDSRAPELSASVALPEGARLVAVSGEAAAVLSPDGTVVAYNDDGAELSRSTAGESRMLTGEGAPLVAPTADLPHHMTYFDGERLVLLEPATLKVQATYPDASGTGVPVGGELLYPTGEGIAVAEPGANAPHRTIPVARDTPATGLAVAGETIVERRGAEVVGLQAG